MSIRRKRYAVLCTADGQLSQLPCTTKNGGLGLSEMQSFVQGYIQTVPIEVELKEKIAPIMVLNEEGKLQGLKVNEKASRFLLPYDMAVGDVLFLAEKGDEIVGFSKKDALTISGLLQ